MNNAQENLIIIGGAEDKKGDKKILEEVCAHIEKISQLLVIVTVATEKPVEVGNEYSYQKAGKGIHNRNTDAVESA